MTWQLGSILFLVSGCAVVDSADLATSGMAMYVSATADGDGTTHVSVSLAAGDGMGSSSVELTSGDRLVARTDSGEVELGSTAGVDGPHYSASVGTDEGGETIVVALLRESQDSAENTSFVLPAPFEVLSPAADATVSLSEGLTLAWDNAGFEDPMGYTVQSGCAKEISNQMPDDGGPLLIEGFEVLKNYDSEKPCSGSIFVHRSALGAVDPAFDGGSVQVEQQRTVDLDFVP